MMATLALAAITSAAPFALQEVTVTATRRPQRAREVAGSLHREVASEFGRIDTTHVAESLNRAPGVFMQRGSGQESLLAIRSPVLTGAGACGAFLWLEDGFPIRPTGFCNVNQSFEINTAQALAIEVWRGPGAAIHGANAVHGVINVVTPRVADLPGQALELRTGAYEHAGVAATLRTDHSALLLDLRHEAGFRADSPVDEMKVLWLHDRDLAGGALRIRAAVSRLDQETAGFIRGFESYRDPLLQRSNPNPEAFREAESARLSARWQRESCAECAEELGLILRYSDMRFLQHFLLGKPLEENSQTSLAVSAARSGPLGATLIWRLGWDGELASTELLQTQAEPTLEGSALARAIRPIGKHYDFAAQIVGTGVQAGLEQTRGRWHWLASVRFDHTRYDYENRMRVGNTDETGQACGFGGCLYSRPADRRDAFNDFTPRFELRYRIDEQRLWYAVLSDGFRPPEITELYRLQRGQNVAELDSERLRALELGWRRHAQKSRVDLALFAQRKERSILRDANGFVIVAGRSRHEGFEYSLQHTLDERWQIILGGTYALHRYGFSRDIEGGERITRGDDIDTAPRHLHGLTIRWQVDERLRLGLETRHIGAYFADAANERRYPGHTLLALRGSYRLAGGESSERVELGFEIDNLLNQRYADRADFAQGNWRYFPGRDRSLFLNLRWRFDGESMSAGTP